MKDKTLAYCLKTFFEDYLKLERNLSDKTIISYNKTFKLLIEYLVNVKNNKLENINFDSITKEDILDFLNYLETNRKCCINTRNQRLAAIKSFYNYCQIENVSNLINIQSILNIRIKKGSKTMMECLKKEELESILNSVNTSFLKGRRDYVLMNLLYDSAARAEELINVKVGDLNLTEKSSVILNGKGKKQRIVPLMSSTKENLIKYLKENNIESGYIFRKNSLEKYNTKLITHIINKYHNLARKNIASLNSKKISPHTFRHTKAIHLLESGVPLIYIRDFLGHASVVTTEIYVQISEEVKRKALEGTFEDDVSKALPNWKDDKKLLEELLSLSS